ncbi:MAG: hypothetical protein JWO30_4079 [Fibrobacteres bacterium]|nr:hypothetical protein [Fibrobacterota bacterium]
MLRLLRILPILVSAASAQFSSVQIRKAVFSDRQLFWPQLEGKAGKAGAAGKTEGVVNAGVGKIKEFRKTAAGAGGPSAPARIAVLPVRITDYQESLPCDSCHRLSANGMEFFLENYFKDRMHDRFPGQTVELIAPNLPLLETRLNLMAYLDSVDLPWDKWLADSGQGVVYRPRDRFTKPASRKRLDKLGGMLGAAYLLLPARVRVKVTPRSSITHEGGLDWSFVLVLWNVASASPEWALQYSEQAPFMNLDESLDVRLDKGLGAVWDGLPAELAALWRAEPR